MFLVEFLKSGNLNRFQFITCTILLIILYFTLNTITNGISSAWGQLLIYCVILLFSFYLFSLFVIARLKECKSKQPIRYGFIVTTPIYTAYIVSLFLFFSNTGYGITIYIASQISVLILFFFLAFKK